MKHFSRKIKSALFILIVCLIAFVGFSKAGILFSNKNMNVITISTTKKRFDPNNYVAAMKTYADLNEEQKTTVEETTTTTIATVTTTKTTTSTQNSVEYTFEGMSVMQVAEILNKSLGGVLKDRGQEFAKLSLEKGMDPFLLAAISVHETGNGTSAAARNKFNFGGIMCSGGLCRYSSVEDGLVSYVNVVYNNYYSKGLTTAEAMNKKYAQSSSWASKVNNWYSILRNK